MAPNGLVLVTESGYMMLSKSLMMIVPGLFIALW